MLRVFTDNCGWLYIYRSHTDFENFYQEYVCDGVLVLKESFLDYKYFVGVALDSYLFKDARSREECVTALIEFAITEKEIDLLSDANYFLKDFNQEKKKIIHFSKE